MIPRACCGMMPCREWYQRCRTSSISSPTRRDLLDRALDRAQPVVQPGRAAHPRQVGAHGADARADAHVVVVEDDDQVEVAERAAVVERLVGVAFLQRAVADHGDRFALRVLRPAAPGQGEPHGGRDARAAVPGLHRVVRGLGRIGEAREAAPLPQRLEARAAPGEQLVRVALVADVPHQLVAVVEVELREQGQGQLDHAQSGSEVPAGAGDGVDDEGADLGGEQAQPLAVHVLHVRRRVERLEQRERRIEFRRLHRDHRRVSRFISPGIPASRGSARRSW